MVGTRSGKVRPSIEVGRILLEARRQQKISVMEVARDLNVSANQIHALEEGDFSVFAAEIYAKGAYMRYAAYLGVDLHHAERSILKALSGARELVPLRLHTPRSLFDRLLTPAMVFSMFGLLIALSIGGYIAWQVESFLQLPQLKVVETKVNGSLATIDGIAEEQAKVNVNGEDVLLREDNSFELNIYLRPGVNVIRVEAENAAGRKKTVEKHVLVPTEREGKLANEDSAKLH